MRPTDKTPPNATPIPIEDSILESLRQAYDPSTIDPALNERLIEAALSRPGALDAEDIDLPRGASPVGDGSPSEEDPSDAERAEATRLAAALDGEGPHPLADLAEALRAARYAVELPPERLEFGIREALKPSRATARVVPLRGWSYAATALALAAGVAIWMLPGRHAPPSASRTHEELALSRSAAPLFAETFQNATATQRIDRIYAVRSRELRHNRYATWRVR